MSGSSKEAAEAAAEAKSEAKAEVTQQLEILRQQRQKKKQRRSHSEESGSSKFDDCPVWHDWFAGLYPFEGQYLSKRDCLAKCANQFRGYEFLESSLHEGPPFVRYDSPLKQTLYLWPDIFDDLSLP